MNRNVLAAILILLLLVVGFFGYKKVSGWALAKKEVEQKTGASDAKVKLTIRGAGDGYLGYGFLTSPEMTQQMAARGLGLRYNNDKGDYAERLKKFNAGEYDYIVLPVAQFLQHGAKYDFPGRMVCGIAESRGADAILAFEDKLPTGKVTDLNNASLKIVYTKDSPSSFLLDLTIVDFDLFYLTKTDEWRQEVGSSEEAFARAKRHDGDAFVMWEPEVSRALKEIPGLKLVHGSDRFSGYIVDVIVFHRDFVKAHEDDAVSFLEAYFTTISQYSTKDGRKQFIVDMKKWSELKSDAEVESAIKKIAWYSLQANCSRLFGINTGTDTTAAKGLINTIISCKSVLVKTGRLKDDALDDVNRIVYSRLLQQVQTRLPAELGESNKTREFSLLSAAEWKSQLREIGPLRVEPISFQQGSSALSSDGEEQVDAIAKLIAINYPDGRFVIKGHTSPGSDEEENVKLSLERTDTVLQRLIAKHGMSPNRFRTEGKGSAEPPARKPDESERAYRARKARVEFVLFIDNTGGF